MLTRKVIKAEMKARTPSQADNLLSALRGMNALVALTSGLEIDQRGPATMPFAMSPQRRSVRVFKDVVALYEKALCPMSLIESGAGLVAVTNARKAGRFLRWPA